MTKPINVKVYHSLSVVNNVLLKPLLTGAASFCPWATPALVSLVHPYRRCSAPLLVPSIVAHLGHEPRVQPAE